MAAVTGIDVSLASTGLARLTTDGSRWLAETWCRPSKPGGRTLTERATRIRDITDDVLLYVDPCDLVVIEAPLPGYGGAGTFERNWLWGHIVSALLRRGLDVVEIPPKTRSKFVAASGGADKAAVALAVGRMWPEWTPGVPHGINDQADALALASVGVVLAEHQPPFPMPVYRTEALKKIPTLSREDL